MKSYIIALIFIGALIVGGIIGFFVTGFVTAGSIEKSATFYYEPSSPEPIESLDIYSDIGEVLIQYNSSNTPYYAEIDVNIEIGGLYMQHKTYTDFFTEESNWWNPTGELNLETKPDIWFDPSYWFKSYNITVIVTLRTDVIYDLNAITATGSVEMNTADNVILNNTLLQTSTGTVKLNSAYNADYQGFVKLYTSTGSVHLSALENSTFSDSLSLTTSTGSIELSANLVEFLDGVELSTSTGSIDMTMSNCTMGNDFLVSVATGSISLDSDNMIYTTDCSLDFETSTGSIDVNIMHNNDLNANLTANFGTSTGSVDVIYRDYSVSNGFKFTGSTSVGSVEYVYLLAEAIRVGDVLTSLNYNDPLVDTYTFTCSTSTGSVNVDARTAI